MKYFLSVPMNGRTNEEIKEQINETFRSIKENDPDAVLIDSFFEGAPHDAKPLWFLGASLQKLSEADVAYFCRGFDKARGCICEFECAKAYGMTCICEIRRSKYEVHSSDSQDTNH